MEKRDFVEICRRYFKRNYFIKFRNLTNEEVVMHIQFDLMREIIEGDVNVDQMRSEILKYLEMWRNEILYKNIKFYSVRFRFSIDLKYLGEQIFYYETDEHMFELFIGHEKQIVNGAELKKILSRKKAEDFRKFRQLQEAQ